MHELNGPGTSAVAINMFETPDDVVIIAAMPGVEPEDLRIRLEQGTLHIASSERGEAAVDKYLCREWSYGPYDRKIAIKTPVDGARANITYGNGVLTLSLPKAERHSDATLEVPKIGRARGALKGRAAG
jgi:HSP20 family protein